MSENSPAFILALSAGFLYACSALLCKRGLELGSGTLRSLVYSNLVMSACFLPYPFFSRNSLSLEFVFYGSLLGLLFFLSQMLCFLSLKRGDASLMTPIMGSKPVFVAIFVAALGLTPNNLTPSIWIAVALATISIALIGWPSKRADFSLVGIFLAVTGASGFGLLDSLVPFFTNQSDPFFLLFIVFGSVGLFSILLIPWTEGSFITYRSESDFWMWLSTLPMGGQAICMSMAIGFYQIPTQANIFYAGRGFWSVILVALIGGLLGLREGKSSRTLLFRRMTGALLLLIGVWLTSY